MFANWRDREKKTNKEQVCTGCLILVYTIDQPIAQVCIKFNFVGLTEKCDKTLMFWNWGKKNRRTK